MDAEFELVERAFDRSVDQVANESQRIGSLLAGQIAFAAIIVDKIAKDAWYPLIALCVLIMATAIIYSIVCLIKPVIRKLAETTTVIKNETLVNEEAASSRKFIFLLALVLTIFVCIWTVASIMRNLSSPAA